MTASASRLAGLERLYAILKEPVLARDCWEHEENCCADWCSECAAGRDSASARQDRGARLAAALAAVEQAAPEICGQSETTKALNLPPDRLCGCGREIPQTTDVFRCLDCAVPFHKLCLVRHCDEDDLFAKLADARAALKEERDGCGIARANYAGLAQEHDALTTAMAEARAAIREANTLLEHSVRQNMSCSWCVNFHSGGRQHHPICRLNIWLASPAVVEAVKEEKG